MLINTFLKLFQFFKREIDIFFYFPNFSSRRAPLIVYLIANSKRQEKNSPLSSVSYCFFLHIQFSSSFPSGHLGFSFRIFQQCKYTNSLSFGSSDLNIANTFAFCTFKTELKILLNLVINCPKVVPSLP